MAAGRIPPCGGRNEHESMSERVCRRGGAGFFRADRGAQRRAHPVYRAARIGRQNRIRDHLRRGTALERDAGRRRHLRLVGRFAFGQNRRSRRFCGASEKGGTHIPPRRDLRHAEGARILFLYRRARKRRSGSVFAHAAARRPGGGLRRGAVSRERKRDLRRYREALRKTSGRGAGASLRVRPRKLRSVRRECGSGARAFGKQGRLLPR